jgi:prolyl-tRNA synthetase
MKLSKSVWQTYKEVPNEAEIPSHQLILRAGLIHKLGSGLYTYMPFAYRTIRKIQQIVREELDKIEAQELLMTVVTPGELWQESGRWDKMGNLMLKFLDKGDRDLCISPTNEEAITDVFRKSVKSYKQLPMTLYQINTKFRDEIRPRFGLMRAREFTMKDAYSFHMDKACLDEVYDEIYQAYVNSFERMGLKFLVVEADAGDMGSKDSKTHEFQVTADTGEDIIIFSEQAGYAANAEKAETLRSGLVFEKNDGELKEVSTPEMSTIKDVCDFLKKDQHHSIKSLVYSLIKEEDEEIVLLQLLGDDELNELKLKNYFGADQVTPTPEHKLAKMGLPKGFIGAVNLPLPMRVFFDKAIDLEASYVTGAMKIDTHFENFRPSRDAKDSEVFDMRLARKGDFTLDGKHEVDEKKGIEVGHIFQLGDKYTKAMNVTVLDNNGKAKNPLMGCYGIGITRVMAAAVEQNYDEAGIIWPKAIAPYHIYFALIGKSEEIKEEAELIYKSLQSAGFEVLFDDRKAGPGFKFKDSDLLGLPIRLVLGERDFKENGQLEIVIRKTNEKLFVTKDELTPKLKEILEKC